MLNLAMNSGGMLGASSLGTCRGNMNLTCSCKLAAQSSVDPAGSCQIGAFFSVGVFASVGACVLSKFDRDVEPEKFLT